MQHERIHEYLRAFLETYDTWKDQDCDGGAANYVVAADDPAVFKVLAPELLTLSDPPSFRDRWPSVSCLIFINR